MLSHNANILRYPGKTRQQMQLPALSPAHVLADERTLPQYLARAVHVGQALPFYSLQNQPQGTWAEFLLGDPLFLAAHISQAEPKAQWADAQALYRAALQASYEEAESYWQAFFMRAWQVVQTLNQWHSMAQLTYQAQAMAQYMGNAISTKGANAWQQVYTTYCQLAEALPNLHNRLVSQNSLAPIWNFNPLPPLAQHFELPTQATQLAQWGQPLLANVQQLFLLRQQIINYAAQAFQEQLQRKDQPAQTGLMLAFFGMLEQPKALLNQATRKHLNFHFTQVLGQQPLPPTAGSTWLLPSLAPDSPPLILPVGTLAEAGKLPAEGGTRLMRTVAEATVSPTQLHTLHTLTLPCAQHPTRPLFTGQVQGVSKVGTAPWNSQQLPNTTQEAAPQALKKAASPQEPEPQKASPWQGQAAQIGWALAAPDLQMAGGHRHLSLTLTLSINHPNPQQWWQHLQAQFTQAQATPQSAQLKASEQDRYHQADTLTLRQHMAALPQGEREALLLALKAHAHQALEPHIPDTALEAALAQVPNSQKQALAEQFFNPQQQAYAPEVAHVLDKLFPELLLFRVTLEPDEIEQLLAHTLTEYLGGSQSAFHQQTYALALGALPNARLWESLDALPDAPLRHVLDALFLAPQPAYTFGRLWPIKDQQQQQTALNAWLASKFSLQYSTAKGWASPKAQPPTEAPAPFNQAQGTFTLQLSWVLPASMPATQAPNPKVHGNTFASPWPVLQLHYQGQGHPLYQSLKVLQLQQLTCHQKVEDLPGVQVLTADGPIEGAAPFMPFGAVPQKGASFGLEAPELHCKPIQKLSLALQWKGLPAGNSLLAHYKAYNRFRIQPQQPYYSNGAFSMAPLLWNGQAYAPLQGQAVSLFTSTNEPTVLASTMPLEEAAAQEAQRPPLVAQNRWVFNMPSPESPETSEKPANPAPEGMLRLQWRTPVQGTGVAAYEQVVQTVTAHNLQANMTYAQALMKATQEVANASQALANLQHHNQHLELEAMQAVQATATAPGVKSSKDINKEIQDANKALKDLEEDASTVTGALWDVVTFGSSGRESEAMQEHINKLKGELKAALAREEKEGNKQAAAQKKLADMQAANRKAEADAQAKIDEATQALATLEANPPAAEDLPNPPYVPEAEGLTLGYQATTTWHFTAGSPAQQLHHYHLGPWQAAPTTSPAPPLLPTLPEGAHLYLGLLPHSPGETLRLLLATRHSWQAWQGSTQWPALQVAACTAPGQWQPVALLEDGTQGLLQHGVVTLKLPDTLAADPPSMPTSPAGPQAWLRITLPPHLPSLQVQCLGLHPIAVQDATPGLPAPTPGSISALAEEAEGIEAIAQPLAGQNGRPAESPAAFWQRVAWHQQTKHRAGRTQDLETQALQAAPRLHMARAIAQPQAGQPHVTLVVAQRTSPQHPTPYMPQVSARQLRHLYQHLAPQLPAGVTLTVSNPQWVYLSVSATIRWAHGTPTGKATAQLQKALRQHLAPWYRHNPDHSSDHSSDHNADHNPDHNADQVPTSTQAITTASLYAFISQYPGVLVAEDLACHHLESPTAQPQGTPLQGPLQPANALAMLLPHRITLTAATA